MPELFTGDTVAAAMSADAPPLPGASPAPDPAQAAAGVDPAAIPATIPQAAVDGSTGPTIPESPSETDPVTGAPPEARWPKILENARQKASAEVKSQYAWADSIPEAHRPTITQLAQTLATEPVKAIEDLMVSAANDPVLAPQLRSLVGRYMRETGEARPAPAATPQVPDPDFQDEQGHTFYSAGRMREALEALEARIDAKYAKELEPLKTDFLTRDARTRRTAEEARATRDADAWATSRYAKVSQWEGFAEHEKAIIAAMTADPALDVGDAYVEVVVPKLSTTVRKQVVTSLQDKAAASSMNPQPASAVAGPPKDFREGLLQMGVGR